MDPLSPEEGRAQFVVQFNLESPVEQALAQVLSERTPVRVGSLRYLVGSELLLELLLRGAEALEQAYPKALGLQKFLQPSSEKPLETAAKNGAAPNGAAPLAAASLADYAAASLPYRPRLDVSSFDFGSTPIHP